MKISIEDPREIKQEEQEIEVNYGDLFEWMVRDYKDAGPCMLIDTGALSFLEVYKGSWTWTNPKEMLLDLIRGDKARLLPKGYKVTIEQE